MISGVPDHVDGRMIEITAGRRRRVINPDRMWHYVEGDPATGTRSGPTTASASSPGRRRCGSTRPAGGCPSPLFPGFDTLGTLEHIMQTGHDHTWFVLTQKIIEKEFALSGSEQNPDVTGKRPAAGAPGPARLRARPARSRRSRSTARTSSSSASCRRSCGGMNELTGEPLVDLADARARDRRARPRDRQPVHARTLQITAIHGARRYLADRVTRIAAPHRILDPDAGPLIAVRLSILTRKTLGGLETDLVGPRAAGVAASRCPGCTPRARSPASAAAACTATARSRARSSAAACSRAAPPAAPPPPLPREAGVASFAGGEVSSAKGGR